MPLHAPANRRLGLFLSTSIENMSESSSMPLGRERQVAPPSVVFHARCGVPAYRMLRRAGSNAKDTTGCGPEYPGGEIWVQFSPLSRVRNTPSSVPAAITRPSAAHDASDHTCF